MTPVEPLRINTINMPHAPGNIASGSIDDHVIVVGLRQKALILTSHASVASFINSMNNRYKHLFPGLWKKTFNYQ